ncbi:MAG: molybdenum cofactor biosynthesis protein MoaE [Cytophagales bacterium]
MVYSFSCADQAIKAEKVTEAILSCNQLQDAGGIGFFIGQVRADEDDVKKVIAIEYTGYEPMIKQVSQDIIHEIGLEFDLKAIYVIHSLGHVRVGEMCLMVCTASKSRKNALEGCQKLVERIKNELPIWGKEIFDNNNTSWKINS